MNITTIKLQKQTKDRLNKLKENKRETSDEVLRKILYILSQVKLNPNKAHEILDRIDDAQKRIDVRTKTKERNKNLETKQGVEENE